MKEPRIFACAVVIASALATADAFGQTCAQVGCVANAPGAPPHVDAWKTQSLPPSNARPTIPDGNDIILYVHGGPGSRAEEAADLIPQLLTAGRARKKSYTVISFDQPTQGYSQMIDPSDIGVPKNFKAWDNSLHPCVVNCTNYATIWTPLLQFSEDTIVDFVNQLGKDGVIRNLASRNVYIIGGSTGGALTLRMGHRSDQPWLKRIVAWSPASVWTSYQEGQTLPAIKAAILEKAQKRWQQDEATDGSSRQQYFEQVYGPQLPLAGIPFVQPNPDEWYRGTRPNGGGITAEYLTAATLFVGTGGLTAAVTEAMLGAAAGSAQTGTIGLTRAAYTDWPAKWDYVGSSRLEVNEVYNPTYRVWHWRLGTEMLLFSFHNSPVYVHGSPLGNTGPLVQSHGLVADGWMSGTSAGTDQTAVFNKITIPTLLAAADDDNWDEGPTLHYENRWDRTREIARLMGQPGQVYFLTRTGHSIHNERPHAFAGTIASFLSVPQSELSRVQQTANTAKFVEGGADECSKPKQLPKLSKPVANLLANSAAATFLMEEARATGNFSDGKTAGTYTASLAPVLRTAAAARKPIGDLTSAAYFYYFANTHASVPVSPGTPAVMADLANAYADLAVTGRGAYEAFLKSPPRESDLLGAASAQVTGTLNENACTMINNVVNAITHMHNVPCVPPTTPPKIDNALLKLAVDRTLARAYLVAWALRTPDPQDRVRTRNLLGWLAVSGEDDPPDRPVNVDVMDPQIPPYPQYDTTVTSTSRVVSALHGRVNNFRIRYIVGQLPLPAAELGCAPLSRR